MGYKVNNNFETAEEELKRKLESFGIEININDDEEKDEEECEEND